jgi:hypothetical protein
MKQCAILDKCGANPCSYVFEPTAPELDYQLPASKPIVSKLPDAFTKFKPHDSVQILNAELVQYTPAVIRELEGEMTVQLDRQLFYEYSKYSFECIYNANKLQSSEEQKLDESIKGVIKGFPQYLPKSVKDETLGFESRFESGNLGMVFKRGEYEYDLFLSPDYKTDKQIGWFFFRVYNTRKERTYRFNICNLFKSDTMFNSGSKILCYSEKVGQFMYRGNNIVSYPNLIKRPNYTTYSTLTFTMTFPEDNDSFFIMNSIPYTYSRLNSFLDFLETQEAFLPNFERALLCETALGNKSPLLTIGSKNSAKPKKAVLIDGRQHPGEPLGSFVVESLILQILAPGVVGDVLRDNYVFYICPMLNPDGVLMGNQRYNSQCLDLNRIWKEPTKEKSPTIFAIKRLAKDIKDEFKDVALFLDIHAHSRKFNCFFYSNPLKDKKDHVMVFLMQKYCSLYSINDTTYKISKEKENSARVIIWREIGIKLSYTLEVGYGGITIGEFAGFNHSFKTLNEIGVGLAKSIVDLIDINRCKSIIFSDPRNEGILVLEPAKSMEENTISELN